MPGACPPNHMFLYDFCDTVRQTIGFNMVWRTLLDTNSEIFGLRCFGISAFERKISWEDRVGRFELDVATSCVAGAALAITKYEGARAGGKRPGLCKTPALVGVGGLW